MVNEKAWSKMSFNSEDLNLSIKEKEFCEENNTEIFPEFSNDFTKDYFCECLWDENILKSSTCLKYLGFLPEKLVTLILLTQFFCDWLHINHFTSIFIEIYKD